MEQTRHQSLVVRNYKKTSNNQLREKSKAIYGINDELNEQSMFPTSSAATSSLEIPCPPKKMKIEIDGNENKIRVTFD